MRCNIDNEVLWQGLFSLIALTLWVGLILYVYYWAMKNVLRDVMRGLEYARKPYYRAVGRAHDLLKYIRCVFRVYH